MKRYFILLVAQVMASVSMMAQVRMDVVMKDGTVKSFATKDITYVKMLNVDKNGHEYVDLGLSVYWATCNVGANAPEEYGGYFAWGETTEKSEYTIETYKWYDASYNLTKYYSYSSILDKEDDVAHVKWGGSWRMPTEEEMKELCTQCTWTWTTLNNNEGYTVTGPNGNSIFMPAAGFYDNTTIHNLDRYGFYWSSVLSYKGHFAFNLRFLYDDPDEDSANRFRGLSVRPVCP